MKSYQSKLIEVYSRRALMILFIMKCLAYLTAIWTSAIAAVFLAVATLDSLKSQLHGPNPTVAFFLMSIVSACFFIMADLIRIDESETISKRETRREP